MTLTTLEFVLGTALLITWAYRWGWLIGAKRMAAAIAGRPAGVTQAVRAWWERRKDKDKGTNGGGLEALAHSIATAQAIRAAKGDGDGGPGQYL